MKKLIMNEDIEIMLSKSLMVERINIYLTIRDITYIQEYSELKHF